MNFYYPWIDPRVKRIRSGDLVDYLRKQAWREEPSKREFFFCYRHPVKKTAVYVPTPEETDDAELCILDAVTQLAKIEERYAGAVLDDLLAARSPDPIAPATRADVTHQPVQG